MEGPREIDPDHGGEVGFGIFRKGLCDEQAGIVDERIDPSVALDGKSHDAIGGLCARDVAIDSSDRRIVALVDRTRAGNDMIADVTIGPEQCRANASRRAGDDGNLPFGFHIRSFTRSKYRRANSYPSRGYAASHRLLSLLSFLAVSQTRSLQR